MMWRERLERREVEGALAAFSDLVVVSYRSA